jgi:hypothetical protein
VVVCVFFKQTHLLNNSPNLAEFSSRLATRGAGIPSFPSPDIRVSNDDGVLQEPSASNRPLVVTPFSPASTGTVSFVCSRWGTLSFIKRWTHSRIGSGKSEHLGIFKVDPWAAAERARE